MKNILFVSVALSVFTVTSASGQKINSVPSFTLNGEGIVYQPGETNPTGFRSALYHAGKSLSTPVATATEFCSALQFKYSQLMNREVESLTNLSLLSFIDDWWGTRYRYGGTTKKGIDCSSFTGMLMNNVFGITLPRTAREQFAMCARIDRDDMAEGDLIFFNTRGGVSHVGVYLGDGYFVHSSCSAGVTISNLNEPYYNRRFISGGRLATNDDCVAAL